jgi:gas vesicle protein
MVNISYRRDMEKKSNLTLALVLATGVVSIVSSLLLAPQTGKETRKQLKKFSLTLSKKAKSMVKKLKR